MEILENPELSSIISWLPDGKSWQILQKQTFQDAIIPNFLASSTAQWPSFTRKLIRWGFRRVSSGPHMGTYYNEYFRRGEYDLCRLMAFTKDLSRL